MRFVDYPRYGKHGWRHWIPSIKQILALTLSWIFLFIGVVAWAYAATTIPDQTHQIAAGSPTRFTFDDGKTEFAQIGLQYDPVSYNQIPTLVQNAVISAENYSFFTDPGVSFTGVARSALNDVFGSGGTQGGSTITQQYVKNAYLTQDQSFARKIQEVFISIKLSKTKSKQEILTDYLNTISFGRGCFGIGAAALSYFHTKVQDITDPAQAAFLAAMIQSPSIYSGAFTSPTAKTMRAGAYRTFLRRYNQVLQNMATYGHLPKAQADALQDKLPAVQDLPKQTLSGYTGYMQDAALAYLAKMHSADPRNGYTDIENLRKGGYTIVTTYNKTLMDDAKAAADQVLWKNGGLDPTKRPDKDKDVHLAFAAVDPLTGYVKAFYSGVDGVQDYDKTQFNAALNGGVQPGSTFKAFTLATALETGQYSPDSTEPADASLRQLTWRGAPMTYVDATTGKKLNWPPNEDGEGSGSGYTTLRNGMWQSFNSVYADLEMEPNMQPDKVLATVNKVGITDDVAGGLRDPGLGVAVPSLTLGTATVSPMRMASAYSTFPAEGVHHDPVQVQRIVDTKTGKILWQAPRTSTRAMSPNTAAGVADVLKGVITDGTAAGNRDARALAAKYPDVAGKTGTTDYNHSAWFNGFSGHLATAVTMYRQSTSGALESMNGTAGQKRINGNGFPTSVWAVFMGMAAKQDPNFAPPFQPYTAGCTPARRTAPSDLPTIDHLSAGGCLNLATPTPTPTPTTPTPSASTSTAPLPLPSCILDQQMQCQTAPTPPSDTPTTLPATPTGTGTTSAPPTPTSTTSPPPTAAPKATPTTTTSTCNPSRPGCSQTNSPPTTG